jgi:glycosyltransferase involved in cell wall biosynthesis
MMRNPRPGRPAAARNAGAVAADGELLAFLDDDDEWLPPKLKLQISALQSWDHVPVVTTGITIVYDHRSVTRVPHNEMVTLHELLRSRRSDMHTSTILVSREQYLGSIGPMDEAMPGGRAEEYDWLLRAARHGPLRTVPKPLVNVFWNPSSWFTHNWKTLPAALTYLVKKHPEFSSDDRGLARIYGQIAFAHAASSARSDSMKWIARTLRLDWTQARAYLAMLVNLGLPAQRIVEALNRFGRSI